MFKIKFKCDCAPKPVCSSPCDFEDSTTSNFVRVHDGMMKMAMNDAYNQQDLAHKAKLQVKVYLLSQGATFPKSSRIR